MERGREDSYLIRARATWGLGVEARALWDLHSGFVANGRCWELILGRPMERLREASSSMGLRNRVRETRNGAKSRVGGRGRGSIRSPTVSSLVRSKASQKSCD
ncbi:hypothetical protein MRB53_016596 [Persea americana]|uniref:Uncharacterized protein n=1 Tax=Persea americana TaxID=3435 RepID=A0ACC2M3Z2_PERAE|nr:hypothetical protein MRB53_016596 [Persea americana]